MSTVSVGLMDRRVTRDRKDLKGPRASRETRGRPVLRATTGAEGRLDRRGRQDRLVTVELTGILVRLVRLERMARTEPTGNVGRPVLWVLRE